MSNGVPAVCVPIDPPPAASMTKWSRVPGWTVKLPDVPVSDPPVLVAVILFPVPVSVTVTDSNIVPPAKAVDVVGVIAPAVVSKSTVPTKLVTVLPAPPTPKASLAVIVTLKDCPAI